VLKLLRQLLELVLADTSWVLVILLCLQLSENAIADYNRARLYLADLANRDGVPVLNDVSEAVSCAIQRLRE